MKSLLAKYILSVSLLPTLVVAVAFAVTCAIECTALPWYVVIVAPLLSLVVLIPIAVWTYRRAAKLESREKTIVRVVVLSSILWGPTLAAWGFQLLSLFVWGLV
jgi:hypothetical protein